MIKIFTKHPDPDLHQNTQIDKREYMSQIFFLILASVIVNDNDETFSQC